MSRLDQPLKLKHGLVALAGALILGAAATAIPMATAQDGGGNLHYVRDSRPVSANSQATEITRCPAGTHVVGGGAEGTAFFRGGSGQMLNTSAPFDNDDGGDKPDDGWIGTMDNFQNADNDRLIVWAICKG
jgi:hypothetical protein